MYQFKGTEETIAAISTPMGHGGIGIVRLSGEDAVSIVDKMFVAKNGKSLLHCKSFRVYYGWIKKGDETIDEVLVTLMRAPHSYTKQDVVEISCHGGIVSLRAILNLATENSARLAEPGEFTKRAFLNGRIDLTQAEAVLDIIQSKTDSFLRVSTNQLKGQLSSALDLIREKLLHAYVEVEAVVNFPEDEVDSEGKKKILNDLFEAKNQVSALLKSSDHGRILKEGIKIVICGKPNVGKSSLLNVLLKEPRAIVSDIEGTTRDTIEETAQIQGIPFQLIDTAGILEPRDLIEEEAVKRSHMFIQSADLILLMLDESQPLTEQDERLMKLVADLNVILVINKSDLKPAINKKEIQKRFSQIISISAKDQIGITELESKVVENIWHEHTIDTHGLMISNLRHINALKDCLQTLTKSENNLNKNLSLEFISEDIKAAVNCLDYITGKNIDEDLLDTIFSQFCIGK